MVWYGDWWRLGDAACEEWKVRSGGTVGAHARAERVAVRRGTGGALRRGRQYRRECRARRALCPPLPVQFKYYVKYYDGGPWALPPQRPPPA